MQLFLVLVALAAAVVAQGESFSYSSRVSLVSLCEADTALAKHARSYCAHVLPQ